MLHYAMQIITHLSGWRFSRIHQCSNILSQHLASQHPSTHPCVNMIPFHLSCSPTSLSSGYGIMIACCTVTFPLAASELPTHTLYFLYCSLRSLASLTLPHLHHPNNSLHPPAVPLHPPLTPVPL